jgi:hypothetical protein
MDATGYDTHAYLITQVGLIKQAWFNYTSMV